MHKIYGLITDENIEKYCSERRIPSFKKEPIERIVNGKRNSKSIFGYYGIKPGLLVNIVEKAFNELEINPKKFNIYLFGSGCYHQCTYGVLNKIAKNLEDNFSVVSFDKHEDCEEGSCEDKKISCGNHHYFSLKNIKNIKSIYVIKEKFNDTLEEFFYVSFFTYDKKNGCTRQTKRIPMEKLKEELQDLPQKIYITNDIDFVKMDIGIKEYETHNQGNIPFADFLDMFKFLLKKKKLVGMDVVGLTPHPRSFQLYDKILKEAQNY